MRTKERGRRDVFENGENVSLYTKTIVIIVD
jgi:hypothetical protein